MTKSILFIMLFSTMDVFAKSTPKVVPAPTIPTRNLKYYEKGKTDGPVIYHQKIQYEKLPNSNLIIKSLVTDPKGNVVFTESIVAKGSLPLSQSSDVEQTKRHLELEVKDGQVFLRTRALGNEKPPTEDPAEEIEKLPPHFITGAMAETFVIEHLNEILSGETMSAKMAIMEIRDIVTFKFFKKELTKYKDRDVVVVAMKPSSIFISMILDTIYLTIDLKDKKMIHYVGRTPLWKSVDGKLKALDAEIVFE